MHLINVLAAGVAGAENGTADIYRKGTSTRAATYSDFYGQSANGTSSGLTLDSNGGVVTYVAQVVDVVVKSSSGATIRSFTAGDDATAINYSGTAFTGTNPVTGATAINQPANLKTILDLFRTSFGTTQGKVSFRSTDRLLHEVLAGLDCFYNVKDPLYGAVGDGSTDDDAAIQAAITAAATAGGGIVFFPEGTYKITTKLTVGLGVSLVGVNPQSTIIASTGNDDVTNITVLFQSDVVDYYAPRVCSGLQFNATGVHDGGSIISLGDAANIAFRDCQFGGDSGFDQCTLISGNASTTGFATFENCHFTVVATGQKAIGDLDSAVVTVRGCRFIVEPATYTGDVVSTGAGETKIRDCSFDASAVAAGTVTCIDAGAYGSGKASICGSYFLGGGGGTVNALSYTAGTLHESENTFSGATLIAEISQALIIAAEPSDIILLSREGLTLSKTDDLNPAPTAYDVSGYGTLNFKHDTNATPTLWEIPLKPGPVGSRLTVIVRNRSGQSNTYRVTTYDAGAAANIVGTPTSASVTTLYNCIFSLESVIERDATGVGANDIPVWKALSAPAVFLVS